jgi:hypothetical protein
MTKIEREQLAALASEAEALQKIWLHEREEQRAKQVIVNAEIRRRWVESDLQPEARGTDQHSLTVNKTDHLFHHSRSRKETRS